MAIVGIIAGKTICSDNISFIHSFIQRIIFASVFHIRYDLSETVGGYMSVKVIDLTK